jgi:hypothetical protein
MQVLPRSINTAVLGRIWREHGVVLLGYLILSLALTWPLARDFTVALIGAGDPQHNLWVLWHYREAFLGREPLFSTSLLYFPHGATLLTHALGPLAGLLALPFWPLGSEAAYNGLILVGFWLTGYCMYLLARALGLQRGIAFTAGTMLLVAPRHITAVWGHPSKVFLGIMPLQLLALHQALNPRRSVWWAIGTAASSLLALLYSSEQFIMGGLAAAFVALASLVAADRAQRWRVLQRIGFVAVIALVITGPLLLATASAADDLAMATNNRMEAYDYQPDLVQFFLPATITSRFVGPLFANWLSPYVKADVETALFLSWTGLLLCLLALLRGGRVARTYVVLLVLCVILALGPELLVLGENRYTVFGMPVVLPYAFLTSLPGLSFLRVPGRFMLPGYVAFGLAAAFGLNWLTQRLSSRFRSPLILLVLALVLLEGWPSPPPQERLRPVPQLYQQIAHDEELYGVFDLPIRPYRELAYSSSYITYSSYYMMYQMTHRKGIVSAYLSRTYAEHPLFSYLISNSESGPEQPDVLVNGQVSDPYANLEYELAYHNYRYVVWHKPQDSYQFYQSGSWGESASKELLDAVFAQREPVVDDELVQVYEVAQDTDTAGLVTSVKLAQNWYNWRETSPDSEISWRWAKGPAELLIHSPRPQQARLEIAPVHVYEPGSQFGVGAQGVMVITTNSQPPQRMAVEAGQRMAVDMQLGAGRNIVTLALEAGSFRPRELIRGSDDLRVLSFAVSEINLITE